MHIREIPAVKRVSLPVGKIREIFLSATVQDLDDERKAVRDALRGRHTTVWLQEDWNQGHGDTLTACAKFLENSSGYIGIVGFFSGWIPDGCDCSITELESSWARHRWGVVDPPPIFYFLPEPGSRRADELMKKSEQALLQRYPDDEDARENRKKLQADFRGRVCGQGRIVLFFSDLQELRERACNAVSLWNEEVLERAPTSRSVAPSFRIPSEELGRIGRELQLEALEALLSERERRPEPEPLCAVVYGPPRSGLLGFIDCLASWSGWEAERKIEPGAPLGG